MDNITCAVLNVYFQKVLTKDMQRKFLEDTRPHFFVTIEQLAAKLDDDVRQKKIETLVAAYLANLMQNKVNQYDDKQSN